MATAVHRTHALLKEVPLPLLEDMVGRSWNMDLKPGDVLLTPGQKTNEIFFVLSGRLRVHLGARDSADGIPVAAGELVGEMSIIEKMPASAWVIAEEPTSVLAMPESVFWDEFITVPEANRRLMQFLIARVRGTDAVLQRELERKIRYEVLQRELESAGKIQANLLPSARPLFRSASVDAQAVIRPARDVGGDFFDAVAIDETRVCAVIGDVSGKGMPAALFMVRVITLLRSLLLERRPPANILPTLNRHLCDGNEEFMFVTLAVAILDTSTGRITYLNGGHNPPAVSSAGLPYRIWDPPKGALLGVAPAAVYQTRELELRPGDTVLLYTDGVTEAENSALEIYGVPRLLGALEGCAPLAPADVVARVESSVSAFVAGAPQSDDITMLAFRWNGPGPSA
jgi:sigma-B regulation protein RsbU (phosphoserine phosphatase)